MRYAVPLSAVYAIDETKVRLVRGRYYYVWIVRDVKTKGTFLHLLALGAGYVSW